MAFTFILSMFFVLCTMYHLRLSPVGAKTVLQHHESLLSVSGQLQRQKNMGWTEKIYENRAEKTMLAHT